MGGWYNGEEHIWFREDGCLGWRAVPNEAVDVLATVMIDAALKGSKRQMRENADLVEWERVTLQQGLKDR